MLLPSWFQDSIFHFCFNMLVLIGELNISL